MRITEFLKTFIWLYTLFSLVLNFKIILIEKYASE